MKTKSIMTDRLELREITKADTEMIVFWRSNYDIYKYFGNPHAITKEEHLSWYKNYVRDEMIKHFIAFEKESGKPIGVFGIKRDKSCSKYAEISSCILDIGERGKGFAQEATNEMVSYAVKVWAVEKVIADVHRENEASKKLFERCGFCLKDNNDVFYKFERNICYT